MIPSARYVGRDLLGNYIVHITAVEPYDECFSTAQAARDRARQFNDLLAETTAQAIQDRPEKEK